MNIMIMRDNVPLIREANFFGGKLLLRDIFCGVFGFFKNRCTGDMQILQNKVVDIFLEMEVKKLLKNDWITAFFMLNQNLKLNGKAFLSYALADEKSKVQQA